MVIYLFLEIGQAKKHFQWGYGYGEAAALQYIKDKGTTSALFSTKKSFEKQPVVDHAQSSASVWNCCKI